MSSNRSFAKLSSLPKSIIDFASLIWRLTIPTRRGAHVRHSQIGQVPTWIAHRRGAIWWIPTTLTSSQRQAFMNYLAPLYGLAYEDALDFLRMALVGRVDPDDDDRICSVLYGAAYQAVTGVAIPGRPFLRFFNPRPGTIYPLTPGACWRALDGDRLAIRILR